MARFDFAIIGGGVSGTTAAEALRERDAHASIAIFEDEPYPLYSRVLIPKYLKGDVLRGALFLRNIENYAEKNIAFYPGAKIIRIDPDKHEFQTVGEIFSYKKLLISAGGHPKSLENFQFPPTKSRVLDKVGTISNFQTPILRMHTLDDADAIKKAISGASCHSALVLGEGLIAMEFVEIFLKNGFSTHVIAEGDYFGEKRMGKSGGAFFEENLKKHGVSIHKNAEPSSINACVIGAGIGIERNLSAFGGLEANIGILTDEFLVSSHPDIYVSGDIAEFFDVILKKRRTAGSWTTAFLQGQAAARNMAGERFAFKNVAAYNISNLGLRLSFLGDQEQYDDALESSDEASFLRFLFSGGKLSGAVVINRVGDRPLIAQLIESGAGKNEIQQKFSL